jgi:hypothetical protein
LLRSGVIAAPAVAATAVKKSRRVVVIKLYLLCENEEMLVRNTPTCCGLLLQQLGCVNRDSTAKIALMARGIW